MKNEKFSDRVKYTFNVYQKMHQNSMNKLLHVIFFASAWTAVILAIYNRNFLFALGVIPAYFFAYAGHRIFEHNRPASFLLYGERSVLDWKNIIAVTIVDFASLCLMPFQLIDELRRNISRKINFKNIVG